MLAALAPPPVISSAGTTSAVTFSDRLIPTKNSQALVAYYCGVFGLIPCLSPVLGVLALIFGILGMRAVNERKVGFGHALTGILLGSLEILAVLFFVGVFVWYRPH